MWMRVIVVFTLLLGAPLPTALALPDEIKAQSATGSDPGAVAFSADGRVAVIVNEGGGSVSVLDTADPAADGTEWATCDGPRAVTVASVSGANIAVIGCEGGVVSRLAASATSLPATWTELTGIALSQTVDVVDLAAVGSDVYVLAGDGLVFHIDQTTSSEDTSSYFPIDTGAGAVAIAASADGQTLVLARNDGSLEELALDAKGYTSTVAVSGEADLVDVVGDGPFYALSSAGGVVSYEAGSGAASALGTTTAGTDLALFDAAGTEVLGVAGGGALSFLAAADGTDLGSVPVSGDVATLAVSDDGYAVAVDPVAALAQVLTDNPWVRVEGVSPEVVTDSEETVTLTLSSDTAGTLSLLTGGDVDGSGSDLQPDITDLGAETSTAVTFSASALASGDNLVFAFVDPGTGIPGRTATVVRSDVSSGIPAPEGFAAEAGNGKVTLQWVPLDESGVTVSHYVVYFADADFDPLAGDPGYCEDEDGDLCSGQTVDHPEDTASTWASYPADDDTGDDDTGDDDTGDDDTSDDDTGDDDTADDDDTVTLTLSPLTNNTTYYFAVAAVTSDDAIGDFTAVVSAMPQETGGAAWLAGEQGGYGCDSCAVGALHGGGVAAVGLLLLAVVLRRTREMR